jgi:pimeloyl-ACP methyl ester carboxylesterase
MELVEVKGLTIAYERAGAGPVVVLLHGGMSDSREWRQQIDGLCDGFTLVAWDAPGCGKSSDPPESFRMPDYAACLAAFIEALALGSPHIVGLSFGGTLALELYRQRPTLVRSLVLVSAYAGWAGSLPPAAVAERLESALSDCELPPEQVARDWVPSLLTDQAPKRTIEELVRIISGFHPAGAPAMARAMAEADLRDVLPTIDIPTLLLHGDADRRALLRHAEELAGQIPNARLAVIRGVGHQSNLEAPDSFNAELRKFLSG